jgi:class 3 adenylate cyclase/tetratricopeptide (TPR) repeat protein
VVCTNCGADNQQGGKFCSQCGTALPRVCNSCGAFNEAGDRFCAECGASLLPPEATSPVAAAPPLEERTPGQYADAGDTVEERRIATILFADLAGFTSLSEGMDPEDVKTLAAHCAQVMSAEVQRFDGTVTGIMGDAIMATFGAPIAHEDDPERAIRAAIAMREQIRAQELGPRQLDLHVGINTGETMAGLIGPAGRQDYTAMGDTTNTAARLMSHASTGSILVGEQTYLATRHTVVFRAAEPISAKGKAAPVAVWEVLDAPPVPEPRPLGTAPFVGRHTELNAITQLWERVRLERRACSLTLVGDAGIGKSRLLHQAADVLEGLPLVLWGRCLAYGEGITYWPVIEMVVSAAGMTHDDDAQVKAEKLGRLIESLPTHDADELQTIATALSNLLALPVTPRGTYLAGQISKGELHWGVRRFFELLATHEYLAVVFEDLHWSERTLLELVAYLMDAQAAILMLASTRPGGPLPNPTADGERHRTLQLAGLSDEEAAAIVAGLVEAGGDGVRLDPLLRAAGGNPLFLEETLRMLASSGALSRELSAGDVPIPTSVQGLIGSRLDLLPVDQKRIAQHGSVIGLTFWSGGVKYIGRWPGSVEPRLEELVARDVVAPHRHSELADEREYEFRHMLIRDVAYGRLPKGDRALLHAACAEWLVQRPAQRDELIEIIAYHWEQACTLAPAVGPKAAQRPVDQAVTALIAAATKAENRDGAREAERFYERALALVGSHGERSIEVRIRRARARDMLGALPEAASELEQAASEAQSLDRQDLRGQALVTLGGIRVKQGRLSEAERDLMETQGIAERLGDRELQLRAAYELAELRGGFEGKVDSAIAGLRRAQLVADGLGDRPLLFEGHLRMATLLFNVGKLVEAGREAALAEQVAVSLGSNRDRARAVFCSSMVALYRAGPSVARPMAADALKWNERVGDYYYQLQSVRALAKCELNAGAPERAEEHLRAARELAEQAGGWLGIEIRRYLVEALVEVGRVPEATQVLADARAAVPPEDEYAAAAVLLAEALVSAGGADHAGAWHSFVEAMRIMESLQLWLDRGDTQILHARALARDGLYARAEGEFAQARSLFAQLGADAMVEDIDRELSLLALPTADAEDPGAGA